MVKHKKIKNITERRNAAIAEGNIEELRDIIKEQDDALMELADYLVENEAYNSDLADAIIELAEIMEV